MNKSKNISPIFRNSLIGSLKIIGSLSVLLTIVMLIYPISTSRGEANTAPILASRTNIQSPVQNIEISPRSLDLEARLACRYKIEEVYWRNRIWPAENQLSKPSLDQLMPMQEFKAKVEDELRRSNALEQIWHRPITGAQLQAEVDRMLRFTRQPQVLSEIFTALDNDPFLIAECLARPVLAERLIHSWYTGTDFDQWWQVERSGISTEINTQDYAYQLSFPIQVEAQDDTWTPTPALPEGLYGSSAVWTGIEMIIWGGVGAGSGGHTNSGARYNPATDTWTTVATIGAPSPRALHTAVWTGSEMVVWGGCDQNSEFCDVNNGGRYDPLTDTWTTTSTTNAPVSRMNHTAVWSGSKMIVWAGCSVGSSGNNNCNIQRNDGGVYDPATDAWQTMSTANAPAAREYHRAVWADTVMVVWGGYNITATNTGGRYDPDTNTWQATSLAGAPEARANLSMVWTGNEVIVWGGCNISLCIPGYTYFNTGGRYNPVTDIWSATNTSGAPLARSDHSAVWTGTEMIVWGGRTSSIPSLDTGSRYNPVTDSWIATTISNAPQARSSHHAVWTGNEMIVWGGNSRTGGRYDPTSDSWVPTSTNDPVYAKDRHTAVWTGTEMLVWGGSNLVGDFLGLGIRFDAVTGTWSLMSTVNEPEGRFFHTAVWTGSKMIVWGGQYGTSLFNSGGLYDPLADSWIDTSLSGAPNERANHVAVWTGNEMLIWGGATYEDYTNTGSRFNPTTNTWVNINTAGAPSGRAYLRGVWSGTEMIAWGGVTDIGDTNTGGRYNPLTNTWSPTSVTDAPTGRHFNTAIWTGSEMIVWGGMSGNLDNGIWYNTGGRYDPTTDSWTATTTAGAPSPRIWHVDAWTGQGLIVWGGCSGTSSCPNEVYTGGRYNPNSDSWMSTSIQSAPSERSNASAVWTGAEMLVWGGLAGNVGTYTTSGGFYHVSSIPNIPPVAFPDSYTTDEDGQLNVSAPGLLENDTDEDGDQLSALLVSNPVHGDLNLSSDGSFTYIPDSNFNGNDTFNYRATDNKALSNIVAVSISVAAINDAPLALDDAYTTDQDTDLVILTPGVLANDSDVDGDTLSAVLSTTTLHGELALDSDGSFIYIPSAGYIGADQFTYQASDAIDFSDPAEVHITVEGTPPGVGQRFYLPFITR